MIVTHGEKWSPALGVKIADFLCGNPNITAAAKIAHGSPKLVFLWMRNSANDQKNGVELEQSKWAIRWPQSDEGEAPLIFFHEACLEARRLFGYAAESQVRSLLASPENGGGGHLRQVLDGSGKPAFEVDLLVAAHALEYDDDLWRIMYADRRRDDVWKRDEKGALVPLQVRDPIPSTTLIHLIRSLFGDTYNPSDRKEIDTQITAVLRVGDKPGAPVSSLRADLEARLAEVRANPGRDSAKARPVALIGRGNPGGDPPERITGAPSPQQPAQPKPSYAKPTRGRILA